MYFTRWKLVANFSSSRCCHLMPTDVRQHSRTCASTMTWTWSSLPLTWILLSMIIDNFSFLSWFTILRLHHRSLLMNVCQQPLMLIRCYPLLQLRLTGVLSCPIWTFFILKRWWTWSNMSSDVIWNYLWCGLIIIGSHIGRFWKLLHPVVSWRLHGRVIHLLFYSQQMLRFISSFMLITFLAGVKARIRRILQSHLSQLLVQLVLIHYIFLFSWFTPEFWTLLKLSPLHL